MANKKFTKKQWHVLKYLYTRRNEKLYAGYETGWIKIDEVENHFKKPYGNAFMWSQRLLQVLVSKDLVKKVYGIYKITQKGIDLIEGRITLQIKR